MRAELCRALLRVGQYRLCRSYLEGLPPAAAEQLVVAAAREVYLSASGMGDRAVKQAKECLGLLPASAAAQRELASISAAEQLQRLGLDLPPLQLQQLQERAAGGESKVLEQASQLGVREVHWREACVAALPPPPPPLLSVCSAMLPDCASSCSCSWSTLTWLRQTATPWASWQRRWAWRRSSSRCCCRRRRRRMRAATPRGPRACSCCLLGSTTSAQAAMGALPSMLWLQSPAGPT